jgi:hypothetical protein
MTRPSNNTRLDTRVPDRIRGDGITTAEVR